MNYLFLLSSLIAFMSGGIPEDKKNDTSEEFSYSDKVYLIDTFDEDVLFGQIFMENGQIEQKFVTFFHATPEAEKQITLSHHFDDNVAGANLNLVVTHQELVGYDLIEMKHWKSTSYENLKEDFKNTNYVYVVYHQDLKNAEVKIHKVKVNFD